LGHRDDGASLSVLEERAHVQGRYRRTKLLQSEGPRIPEVAVTKRSITDSSACQKKAEKRNLLKNEGMMDASEKKREGLSVKG